jgi:hypothetical protein
MPGQPQSSGASDALVRDEKDKQQAEWSFTIGADAKTFEEREDEREVISHARPGGLERVASEQRLPAEGIGASDGELRQTFDHYPEHDPAAERDASGELSGGPERRDADRRDEIRC